MPRATKIATCCYCGTRAVLAFDRARHELACSACGAPLHEMKAIPVPAERAAGAPEGRKRRKPPKPGYPACRGEAARPPRPKKRRRKRKSRLRRVLEEVWDAVEDVFD